MRQNLRFEGVRHTTEALLPAVSSLSRYDKISQSGVMGGGKLLAEHLGKNLSHHQVIHAASGLVETANRARLDVGKVVASATGGNPRLVNQAISRGRFTLPIAPFDRRAIARSGIEGQLKHTLSQVSIKS